MVSSPIGIRHHFYGSTPTGFTTLVSPPELERQEILGLERRCSYDLPTAISLGAETDRPVKWVFFTVGEWAVVGRAVDRGIDLTGRRGNYLFHNILVERSEAAERFDDPASLATTVERAGLFRAETPPSEATVEGSLLPLELPPITAPLSGEMAHPLVSFALAWQRRPDVPAVLLGDSPLLLEYLRSFYALLPRSLRWILPFDTYAYGVDVRGLALAGVPTGKEYRGGATGSTLKIDTTTGAVTWRAPIPADPMADYLAILGTTPVERREAFLSCVDLVEQGQWEELPGDLDLLDNAGLSVLYSRYREGLLRRITGASDLELFSRLASVVSAPDLAELARGQSFASLIQTEVVRAKVVEACIATGPSSPLLGWIALDKALLNQLLDRLGRQRDPESTLAYLRRLVGLAGDLDLGTELAVFRAIDSLLGASPFHASGRKTMVEVVRQMPQADPLRMGIRKLWLERLGDPVALDELLASSDMALAVFGRYSDQMTTVLEVVAERGGPLRGPLTMLVSAALESRLPADRFESACMAILESGRSESGGRRRLAKDLADALRDAPHVAWVDRLRALYAEPGGGGIRSFFKGGKG